MGLFGKSIVSVIALLVITVAFQPAVAHSYLDDWENADEAIDDLRGDDEIPGPFRDLAKLVSDLLNATTDTNDTDGDKLPDSVEWVIGTNSSNADSDMDGLSDYSEVFNSTDPNAPDSNNDQLADFFEVVNVPFDLDGDGVPNAWDWDNDDDGVIDRQDLSPFAKTNLSSEYQLEINTSGKPTYIDIQLRTKDPDHMRLILKRFDWPDDDKGDVRDLDGSTDDARISPILEFRCNFIPNQSDVEGYGIVTTNDTAFIPLYPTKEFGNIVALKGRMFYPENGSPLDLSVTLRLSWILAGNTDSPLKALGAYNGLNVSVGDGERVVTTSAALSDNETLEWVDLGNDRVALMGANGLYLSIEDDGIVSASADLIDERESFILKSSGGQVTLKAYNGRFLAVQDNGTIVANATSTSSRTWFDLIDMGYRIQMKNLAVYYEDFMLTGLRVEEHYSSKAGVFYGDDKDHVLGANLQLSYEFLRNATHNLTEMPARLAANDLVVEHNISTYDHVDQALEAILNDMIPDAMDSLSADQVLPIISTVESVAKVIDMSHNDSGGSYILGSKIKMDITQETTVTSRALRTRWFNTSHPDQPLGTMEIMETIRQENPTENTTITLTALIIAWTTGEQTVVRLGDVDQRFDLPEQDLVPKTVVDTTYIGIESFGAFLGGVSALDGAYHVMEFGKLKKIASSWDQTGYKMFSHTFKEVNGVKTATRSFMDILGLALDVIGLVIDLALIAFTIYTIGDELGWTPTVVGMAVVYGIITTSYAVAMFSLAVFGGPPGAIIAAIIALSDLFAFLLTGSSWSEEVIGWLVGGIVDAFSGTDMRCDVELKRVNSTTTIDDKDGNGLDAGDRITYESNFIAYVKRTYHGGLDDLEQGYIIPRHIMGVPWNSGSSTGSYTNNTSAPSYSRNSKSTWYKSGAWVEPGIGMVNFPVAIGLKNDYRIYYNDYWWFLFVKVTDRESYTGTSVGWWSTLSFDVLPGSIEEFARWRGIGSNDHDGDGLNNTAESGTNPWNWDSDGDGLGDLYERVIGSDPTTPDTDGDGLDDRFEHTMDMNLTEKDSDSDGLSDYLEYRGWIVPFSYSGQQFYWHVYSDARLNDTDGDGLDDWLEYYCLLNPISYDTDGDGTNDQLRDFYKTEFEYDSTLESTSWDSETFARIKVDSEGYLYVLCWVDSIFGWNAKVLKYYPNGTFKEVLIEGSIPDIEIDSNDYLYIIREKSIDYHIERYDRNGTYVDDAINSTDLHSPALLAIDEGLGFIYVVEEEFQALHRFHFDNGTYDGYWSLYSYVGSRSSSGGMDVDKDGYLYIPVHRNSEKTFLFRFHPNRSQGEVIGSYGYSEGQFIDPLDVLVDPNGDLLVADSGNNRIQKINSTGRFLASFGTTGSGDENLSRPTGVALFGDYLYVLDDWNDRIQKIEYKVWLERVTQTQDFNDTDGDGLSDDAEEAGWNVTSTNASQGLFIGHRGNPLTYRVTSDPLIADSDGDGVSDLDEFNISSDPMSIDTDRDGISDAIEVAMGTNATHCDSDEDGLVDGTEVMFGSDPLLQDTDGEGLSDLLEFQLGSDPRNNDTDQDGLDDATEVAFGSNLTNPDEDGDFMFDSVEYDLGTISTDPDYDKDGIMDGFEALYNTSPKNGDTDGDGLLDGEEIDRWMNPLSNDTDGDGLLDLAEIENGLNPRNKDSDGDGVLDGADTDFEIQLDDDVHLVIDPDDENVEFVEGLSKGVDLSIVSADELLSKYKEKAYIVLVGWPEEANGTAGGLIHDILSVDAPDLLQGMLETSADRLVVRYGKWASTQTIVMLSRPERSDHIRVMGLLKSMRVTVVEGTFMAEFLNPRSNFAIDHMEALSETDTMVTTKLDEMAKFSIELERQSNESLSIAMSNVTGLEPVEVAMGKYVDISVNERLQNDTGDIITGAKIELFYTLSDLDRTGDGNADDPDDLNESSLRLYVLDEGTGSWIRLTDDLDWVNETGVNTTDVTLYGREYEGCVWAYVMHFSTFGIAGRQYRVLPTLARAGSDLEIYEGDEVAFNGTASSGNGLIVDLVWTFEYEGEPVALEGPTPTFLFGEAGVYTITLTVTDYLGHKGTDTKIVTVNAIPPGMLILKVGPVKDEEGNLLEGASVNITLGEDTHSNVTDALGIARFELNESVIGSDVAIAIGMEGFEPAEYQTLINTEGGLDQEPPTLVKVGEILPTIARAGSDKTVQEGDEISFDGSASEGNDGIANFTWTFEYEGDVVELYEAKTSFLFEVAGEYVITLNVTDGLGLTDETSITITVLKTPVETWTLGVGPVRDESMMALEGALVTIRVSTEELTNTTDEYGETYFELPVAFIGLDIEITIQMEGYETAEYQTRINALRELDQEPPDLVESAGPPPSPTEEDGFPLVLAVAAALAIIVLLGVLLLFTRRPSPGGREEGEYPEEAAETGGEEALPTEEDVTVDVEAPMEEDGTDEEDEGRGEDTTTGPEGDIDDLLDTLADGKNVDGDEEDPP